MHSALTHFQLVDGRLSLPERGILLHLQINVEIKTRIDVQWLTKYKFYTGVSEKSQMCLLVNFLCTVS